MRTVIRSFGDAPACMQRELHGAACGIRGRRTASTARIGRLYAGEVVLLKHLALSVILALLTVSAAFGQTVNGWYPDYSTLYHVKSCLYNLRSFNGGSARIGASFVETPGSFYFYFYFTPTDSVQLQKASAIYASSLAAETSGINAYVFISAGDTVTGGWDFISIQLGPN